MVRIIPSFPRATYSPREQWSANDRFLNNDPSITPSHFSTLPNARSPVTTQVTDIETALRERCGIQVKDFAMIATLEDGTTATFTSEKVKGHEKYLFSQQFQEAFFRRTDDAGSGNPAGHYGFPSSYNDFENANIGMRRQSGSTDSSQGGRRRRNKYREESIKEDSEDEDTIRPSRSGRKRHRGAQDDEDDNKPPPMAQSVRYRNLVIGDTAEVTKFFEGRFRDMQQASCKIIAKAFIKVVEPKKQTNHPYTGGAERAPEWWPPLPTENKTGGVKHREPDHLLKPERVELLIHILRLGHMSTRKGAEHVQIKELQAKTKEALLSWVGEKPANKAKMKYLDEIFKVAKAEERMCRGEIDASYTVPVMHGADLAVPDTSEDEGGDDNLKEEEDDTFQGMTPQSAQILTPDSMVSPTSTHSHSSGHRPLSSNTMSGFNSFSREIPVRQYQPSPHNNLPPPAEQPNYENDSLTMGVQTFIPSRGMADIQHQHQNHGLPDNSRRPTWHHSSNFPAPSNNLFQSWPNNNTMMPGPSNPVHYNSYPAPSPTPLPSNINGPLLPLPNTPSGPTTLLPPMHNPHHHPSQQNSSNNFHDPSSSSTMSFRDQTQNSVGVGVGGPSNSLRTASLSTSHHGFHSHPQGGYMNEYLHDYTAGPEVGMKDENIGSGGVS